ncbi:hypothetical protein DSO57_1035802 [Entomophthora muscae]|uniref:Uncharacterized protein n=1 Tax=Entomophthora muscae TaxID=34485 RepID=A0ACC2SZF3_9FUNG|nr:hypothetical protein DSO57_1035802 [Entomophthora muscae]
MHGGDARLAIEKVLEEFAVMQDKYKLLENHSPLLGNDNSYKPVPGYDQGHTLGTGNQEPHRYVPKGKKNSMSRREAVWSFFLLNDSLS